MERRITTTPTTTKLRHELKHTIAWGEDLVLAARLRQLFAHDSHAGADGAYRVTSLYFDTPTDKALREKVDGVNRREKFRLRYYNGDTGFIRLEKKWKVNGLCGKRSASVTREEVERLLRGDTDFLLASSHPLLWELHHKMCAQRLAPRTVVTYDREAFLYEPGNVRITLDRGVRTGLGSPAFLEPALLHVPVADGLTVLEVKYDEFLPDIVRMAVQVPNRQAAAYSKYAVSRRYD